MTCTAEDTQGDLYPVTEDGYYGIEYQSVIDQIEDEALDYCYSESGGDESCYLVGCTPDY